MGLQSTGLRQTRGPSPVNLQRGECHLSRGCGIAHHVRFGLDAQFAADSVVKKTLLGGQGKTVNGHWACRYKDDLLTGVLRRLIPSVAPQYSDRSIKLARQRFQIFRHLAVTHQNNLKVATPYPVKSSTNGLGYPLALVAERTAPQ